MARSKARQSSSSGDLFSGKADDRPAVRGGGSGRTLCARYRLGRRAACASGHAAHVRHTRGRLNSVRSSWLGLGIPGKARLGSGGSEPDLSAAVILFGTVDAGGAFTESFAAYGRVSSAVSFKPAGLRRLGRRPRSCLLDSLAGARVFHGDFSGVGTDRISPRQCTPERVSLRRNDELAIGL